MRTSHDTELQLHSGLQVAMTKPAAQAGGRTNARDPAARQRQRQCFPPAGDAALAARLHRLLLGSVTSQAHPLHGDAPIEWTGTAPVPQLVRPSRLRRLHRLIPSSTHQEAVQGVARAQSWLVGGAAGAPNGVYYAAASAACLIAQALDASRARLQLEQYGAGIGPAALRKTASSPQEGAARGGSERHLPALPAH